jgi:hypothetical protein
MALLQKKSWKRFMPCIKRRIKDINEAEMIDCLCKLNFTNLEA